MTDTIRIKIQHKVVVFLIRDVHDLRMTNMVTVLCQMSTPVMALVLCSVICVLCSVFYALLCSVFFFSVVFYVLCSVFYVLPHEHTCDDLGRARSTFHLLSVTRCDSETHTKCTSFSFSRFLFVKSLTKHKLDVLAFCSSTVNANLSSSRCKFSYCGLFIVVLFANFH